MMRAGPASLAAILFTAAGPAHAQTSCTNPALCGLPVASTIGQADLAVAIDVVLVGDGFVNMSDWHTVASGAISAFQGAASNMYGRVPNSYNFHVVDVTSAGTDVSNTDLTDTALGMRVSGSFITVDQGRANLAALNAPDVDVVVSIANSGSGRANANYPAQLASGGAVRLSRNTSVITHELGHALFNLADEYEEAALCNAPSETLMMREPNVTTDATCHKFGGIAGAGCVQGGRYCSTGTYRSAGTCLMRTNNGAACPACARELDDVLRERRSQADWAPPWLVAATPGNGAPVAGSITLSAYVHDDWFSPTAMAFEVDGAYVGATSGAASGQIAFDTTRLADGPHAVRVFGADQRGSTAASREVSFSALNQSDLTAPVVSVGAPTSGANVSGVVSIIASVAAPAGDVRELVLRVDGQVVAGASGTGSIFFGWDTGAASLGAHTIDARAVDYSENVGVSATVSVNVIVAPATPPPFLAIASPRDGSAVGPYFLIQWSAEGGGGSGVQGGSGGVPVALVVDGVAVTPNPLLGRARSAVIDARSWSLGPHQLRVRTTAAQPYDSPPILVWRSAITEPEAFIRTPESGSWLRVATPVAVLGVDDVAIASVTLWMDGAAVGSVSGAAGDVTVSVAGRVGCAQLQAEALSSDGGRGSSAPITLCFDDVAPVVAIDWPAPGAAVAAGPLVVRARVTESGSGVERLTLRVDGAVVATAGSSGALATTVSAGPHTLLVTARDRAGNEGTSAPVVITAGACAASGCDDGDACTIDHCGPSGACVHARTLGCCATAADCADGDACTGETCVGGACSYTAIAGCCNHGFDCNDGDRCTSDLCSGPGGTCSHPPAGCCSTAADCDDGRSCTTDSCVGGPNGACAHDWTPGCCSVAADCDDGDACTTDACGGGSCTHTPIPGCCRSGADCNDNDACTSDVCRAGTCGHSAIAGCCASAVDCASLNPCVTTTCNARGACEGTPIVGCCVLDLECADADPCTVHACSNNTCVLVSATAGCADAGVTADSGAAADTGTRDGGAAVDASARDATSGPDAAARDAASQMLDASVAPDVQLGPDATVGGDDAMVGREDATVGGDAMVGGDDAMVGGEDAMVGGDDATVGGEDATVGGEDATAGGDDATVVADDATVVADDATPTDDAAATARDGGASSSDAAISERLSDGNTPDPITGSCSCSAEETSPRLPWTGVLAFLGLLARRRTAVHRAPPPRRSP